MESGDYEFEFLRSIKVNEGLSFTLLVYVFSSSTLDNLLLVISKSNELIWLNLVLRLADLIYLSLFSLSDLLLSAFKLDLVVDNEY